jgi:hypothetical protein
MLDGDKIRHKLKKHIHMEGVKCFLFRGSGVFFWISSNNLEFYVATELNI